MPNSAFSATTSGWSQLHPSCTRELYKHEKGSVLRPHQTKFLFHSTTSPLYTRTLFSGCSVYPESSKAWLEPCKHSMPRKVLLNQREWCQSFQNPGENTGYSPAWESICSRCVTSTLPWKTVDTDTIQILQSSSPVIPMCAVHSWG